ncbi:MULTISPECIES: twin-arginine translocase subunit TatB [unclassified Bartonella]|uniref:twin-arginine translocase subunit TatB n=1 Tax=unclassified Bartonella TaxID=2645622 RepID=UPI0035D10D48
MFGIDGPEFVVILLVLIIVVGPKDLPKILKTIAKVRAHMCLMAKELRHQFDDAIRQIELDDLQKTYSDISDSSKKLTETFDPIQNTLEDIHDNLDVKATHHKSEKGKDFLECDHNVTNKDMTGSIASKDKEDVS